MKHHGNLTEKEKEFIGSLSALLIRHDVGIVYDSHNVPVFVLKSGESGVFLSIHDLSKLIIYSKES